MPGGATAARGAAAAGGGDAANAAGGDAPTELPGPSAAPARAGGASFALGAGDLEEAAAEPAGEAAAAGGAATVRVAPAADGAVAICGAVALPVPPRAAYELLCHPDNAALYRTLDRCTYRRVLSAAAPRRIEVAHEASWRFLLLGGRFTTRLAVDEDPDALTTAFSLVKEGSSGPSAIMRLFEGRWAVAAAPGGCVARLEQRVALHRWVPPPGGLIVGRICEVQVRGIFEDLRAEAERVAAGRPTLVRPYAEVADEEIG